MVMDDDGVKSLQMVKSLKFFRLLKVFRLFRVLRIQQETIDGLVEGRPLSLCEVQILPMRLQSIQCDGAEVLVDHHLLKQNYHLTNRTFGDILVALSHYKYVNKILKKKIELDRIFNIFFSCLFKIKYTNLIHEHTSNRD
jgi:hypothetical protein